MELDRLTRELLFNETANRINQEEYLSFKDKDEIITMYYDSAKMLYGLEAKITSNEMSNDYRYLMDALFKNCEKVDNKPFVYFVSDRIQPNPSNETNTRNITSKLVFNSLLRAITEYQEIIISKEYLPISNNYCESNTPQTFLSYAYSDKGLSLSLFYYFLIRGGFLYVDWMWQETIPNGGLTKTAINEQLIKSNQLLFLRTPNSELHLKGNHSIRQWCSWEIGNFYTKSPHEKYYTNFYDTVEPANDILDTFYAIKDVVRGSCVY